MSDADVQDIKKSLARLERGVFGEAETGHLGLLSRTNNHAGRLKKLELWVFRIGATVAGATAVISLAYKVLTDWWPKVPH